MRISIGLAVIACCALPALSSSAQTEVPNPADPYVQEQTGMRFPAQIANSVRHQVTRYAEDGSDTGIGYQVIKDGKMIAYVSMFFYPAPSIGSTSDSARAKACKAVFDGIKGDVRSHDPSTRLVSEQDAPAPFPIFHAKGLRATFAGGSAAFDGKTQRVHDEAYLYCYAGGQWLVAYRATWPETYDATREVNALIGAVTWSEKLARP
jgi:hypothetical protein